MTSPDDRCALCGVSELPHKASERAGQLHHAWSPTGKLVQVDNSPGKRRSPQSPILVVGAVDTQLRQLLIDKGILTHEDFASLLSAGPGTGGDRAAGETQSSE